MSPTKAEADRTPGVEPPIEPRAAWRVRDVRIIAQGLLDVRFVDGTEGIVDLRPRLGRVEVPKDITMTLEADVTLRLAF